MTGAVPPRAATVADLPQLARILGQWCADTPWMPKLHDAEEDLWFLGQLHTRGTLRVACCPGTVEPGGFLARRGGEVDALYLAPDARRLGLGRALMAETMAAEPVLALWTFAANTPALAFYAALGFAETGRTDGQGNDERLPDVRLEWRRDAAAS